MEKREQETKQTKNVAQKAKKIRSIVMLSLLCILLLSAATYAWFTLSNTAKVSNLTMKVGDVTGLQIAPSDENGNAGTYGAVLDMTNILKGEGKLLPATTTDGRNFKKPDYDDNGAVSGITPTTDGLPLVSTASDKGYFVKYDFYLKSLGETVNVKLKKGTNITNGLVPTGGDQAGTYVLSESATDGIIGSASIRISFVPDGSATAAVYEPNYDIADYKVQGSASRATDNSGATAVISTIRQKKTGEIADTDGTIVSLTAGEAKKISMYIWIEGTDDQCSNEIALKKIKAQLQFTTDANPNA